jgi:hypothetical protein
MVSRPQGSIKNQVSRILYEKEERKNKESRKKLGKNHSNCISMIVLFGSCGKCRLLTTVQFS